MKLFAFAKELGKRFALASQEVNARIDSGGRQFGMRINHLMAKYLGEALMSNDALCQERDKPQCSQISLKPLVDR